MRLIIALLGIAGFGFSSISTAENLNDIYQLAVENDPIMKTNEAQLRSGQESYKIARSQLLPHLYLSASYGKSEYEQTTNSSAGDTAASAVSTSDTTDKGIQATLTQQIFDMEAWYTFKGGKRLSEKAELEFMNNQQSLLYRTVEAYFYVLRSRNNLISSIAEENAIKQHLDQTRQRFDVGLVAITDVHESQSAYDLTKVSRLANEGNLEIAYESLSLLTGKKHDSLDMLSENFPAASPEPANMNEWVQLAQSGSYEIKIAEKMAGMAQYQANAYKSRHYPVLALNANKSKGENEGLRYTIDDIEIESDSTNIALVLTVPLYSGGAISAGRRQAYADLNIAQETLDGLKRSVTQQTRAQYIAVTTHIQKVAAHKQAIVSAKSALDAIEAGYNVGTRNIVDVLTAQKNLFAAERDYANSRYDYILSMITLKKLTGSLTPADIQSINQWISPDTAATKKNG